MDGGTTSTWCDPYGVYLTGKYATPVYELLGVKGLVMNDPKPVVDKAYIDGTVAYRVHKGGHTDAPEWPSFLEFAERQLDMSTLWPSVSTVIFSPKPKDPSTINITSTRDWTVECEADWLTIEPLSDSGNCTITVKADGNTGDMGRQATVSIKSKDWEQHIVVNQESARPQLSVSNGDLSIGPDEGNMASFDLKSNTAWKITVEFIRDPNARQRFMMGPGNWLTASNDFGVNSATISVVATANPGVSKRIANITVSAEGVSPQKLIVTQEEGKPTLDIPVDTLAFYNKDGNISVFRIMTNSTWSAECSEDWITVDPETGGNFSQVTVMVKDNKGTDKRSGEIVFSVPGLSPKVVCVKQDPAPDE
jgi:hypothetical protein